MLQIYKTPPWIRRDSVAPVEQERHRRPWKSTALLNSQNEWHSRKLSWLTTATGNNDTWSKTLTWGRYRVKFKYLRGFLGVDKDATKHLYKRVFPSVRPSVGPSVRRSIRRSVRRSVTPSLRRRKKVFRSTLCRVSGLFLAISASIIFGRNVFTLTLAQCKANHA